MSFLYSIGSVNIIYIIAILFTLIYYIFDDKTGYMFYIPVLCVSYLEIGFSNFWIAMLILGVCTTIPTKLILKKD